MDQEPVDVSVEDFLMELSIAPKWNIYQDHEDRTIQLVVLYSFGTWIYRSPSLRGMTTIEAGDFYGALRERIHMPTIRDAKAILWPGSRKNQKAESATPHTAFARTEAVMPASDQDLW